MSFVFGLCQSKYFIEVRAFIGFNFTLVSPRLLFKDFYIFDLLVILPCFREVFFFAAAANNKDHVELSTFMMLMMTLHLQHMLVFNAILAAGLNHPQATFEVF